MSVLTLHPCKFTTSNWWQNLAKQITALLVICLHPLLMKLLKRGQPLAKASIPFSVMLLHQLMLIWVKFGQPSLRAFRELSVMAPQPSRFNFCNLEQWRDKAVHVESVSFLQPFKLRSSTFGHNWARVFIEPSAMDWQPRRESCRRKPTQRRDMFSIIGPWNVKIFSYRKQYNVAEKDMMEGGKEEENAKVSKQVSKTNFVD